jgi:CHAD domain-containing protein
VLNQTHGKGYLMLPDTTMDTLQRYLEHPIPHIRSRAEIIVQTLNGKQSDEIAAITGVSLRTIKKWQAAWDEQGLNIFPPTPTPPKLELQATDSLADAGRQFMLQQLNHFLEYEPAIREDTDIEHVHQMRVASRRWRSAFKVYGAYLPNSFYQGITEQLRDTAKALGRVRDLDVLYLHVLEYSAANSDALQPIINYIEKERRKAHKKLVRWFDNKQYQRFIKRGTKVLTTAIDVDSVVIILDEPFSTRLNHLLPVMIYQRFEAVRAYDELINDASFDMLHKLRVDFKRLRYTLEAFESVLGSEIVSVIETTKVLQDHLGALNDARVAVRTIRQYEKQLDKPERDAAKAYRKSRKAEAENLRATFADVWAQFNQPAIRQALAQAVGVL